MKIKKFCLLSNGTLKEEYDILNIIRCKDCKYWFPNKNFMEDSTFYYCSNLGVDMDADDFCSRGEKND